MGTTHSSSGAQAGPGMTPAGGPRCGGATFTAYAFPRGRAHLEEGGSVAVGTAFPWTVVTVGDVMRDGVWEWEVELMGGWSSSQSMYAVFEGTPASNAPSDASALCAAMSGTLRYIRGANDEHASALNLSYGAHLRVRYEAAPGTVAVSVDGGSFVRALDGVRRGDALAGFFLAYSGRLRLCAFGRVDVPELPLVVRGCARGCVRCVR